MAKERRTAVPIPIPELMAILERINVSLGLRIALTTKDPNVIPLIDRDGERVAVVDLVMRRVRWDRRPPAAPPGSEDWDD